jgi:SAM-dependent methyltransferase
MRFKSDFASAATFWRFGNLWPIWFGDGNNVSGIACTPVMGHLHLTLAVVPIVAVVSLIVTAMLDYWVDDRYFDRSFGVETSGKGWASPLHEVVIGRDADDGYMPAPARSIRSLLASLPIDHADFTFVDLGSGKGRAMLVAAEFAFRRIVGVELSPDLDAVALANIAAFKNPSQKCFALEPLCMDARDFVPPAGPLVAFIFNAFERDTMARVVGNLARSHDASPRPIYLVYFHPHCDDVIAKVPCFHRFSPAGALTDYFEVHKAAAVPSPAARRAA